MFPGKYFTGDGCRVDPDGFYWLMGRMDDVINVSGHRIGTAEIESALVSHPGVAEAAVVGFPHEIKGQGIYCFVTLKQGVEPMEELRDALVQHVRAAIGAIATPEKIQFTDSLPKTRSGKIVRRILRKIASGDTGSLGDTTTLADPALVDILIKNRVQSARCGNRRFSVYLRGGHVERRILATVLIGCFSLLSGCATLAHGTTQSIDISSNPPGAAVSIDGVSYGQTPVTATLQRKDNHLVKLELTGYEPYETTLTRETSGWAVADLLCLIGLAVDAVSGGLYNITPEQVSVDLRNERNRKNES